jgi:hypothetical protein
MTTQAHQAQPQKPGDERRSAKDVVGVIANMLSVGTATAFVLSVVYEQAYFSVIGRKFQNIASLSDYLTNVLDWLPTAVGASVAGGFLVLVYVMILRAGVREYAELLERQQARSASPAGPVRAQGLGGQIEMLLEHTRMGGKRLTVVFIAMAMGFAAMGTYIYLTSDPAHDYWALWLSFAFLLAWSFACAAGFMRSSLDFMGPATKLVVVLAPAVVFGVFAWGLQSGYRDLTLPGEAYSLVRNQPDAQVPEKVNVLRTFERGILVRLPDQKVNEFLRWDQFRAIRLQRDGESGKSLGCRQLGWPC